MDISIPKGILYIAVDGHFNRRDRSTYMIANGCQSAFNFNPRWLALAIVQVISLSDKTRALGGFRVHFG